MALFLNKVEVAGMLGNNPDVRYFMDGTPTCSLSLAVKKTWKNKDGTPQEKTTWVSVKFNGAIVTNFIEKYIGMGDNVYIEGEWDDYLQKDEVSGRTYKTVYLKGDEIKIIQKAKPKTAAEQPAPPPSDDEDDEVPFT